ncbi:MAG TPA: efflux RND transporter periplasmic adaptor subunit [Ghiorsea sp.]|nr:efflux RND transporter periplasmic adaptor subunit [Ghiorsea sp.]HIP07899.1 efflux RND transporter periplasmic adaptor subunit [Mariprofundaceae bacterium]
MKKTIITILTLMLLANTSAFAAEDNHQHEQGHDDMAIHGMDMDMNMADTDEHDDHDKHEGHNNVGGDAHGEEEAAPIKLSPAQIKQAGIQTLRAKLQTEKRVVTAPGSVSLNGYLVAEVTALVDGVVEKRFVRLGDNVKRGQRLLTLNSSALAQAQAKYLRAEGVYRTAKLDVQRLQGLVEEKIISQARFQQAQSTFQGAKANLAAAQASLSSYGMRNRDIDNLMTSKQYGKLVLRAPSSGTVTSDDFRLGQHIAAGSRLMQVVDESSVWVKVKLSQSQIAGIHAGEHAVVTTKNSKTTYPAKVINVYHQLDTTTRTVGVRLEVKNPKDTLHPGMFVTAEIESGRGDAQVLLLPEEAVQRQGSELIVFIEEETGHFERREVEVGKTRMGLVPILKGIQEGESVVIKGAFVLASELAKSGFAVHNH